MSSNSTFQRIGRPLLVYAAGGCYILSLNNFYWEYKVKNHYQQWFLKQQEYFNVIKQIDPSMKSTIEAPAIGFNTSAEKVYKLGVHLQSNLSDYETRNQEIYQTITATLTDASQSQIQNNDSIDESKEKNLNSLFVPSDVLLGKVSQKFSEEKDSREKFLSLVNNPTFMLIDSDKHQYRYKNISLVKIGAISHLLSMGGKYGPLLSIAVAASLLTDLHEYLTENTRDVIPSQEIPSDPSSSDSSSNV